MSKIIVKKYFETEFDKISVDKRGEIIRIIFSYKDNDIFATDWIGLTDGDSIFFLKLEEDCTLRLPLVDL